MFSKIDQVGGLLVSDLFYYSAGMMKNEKISIDVDGVIVRGRARIEPCKCSVRITDPFHELQAEMHVRGIMRMTRPFEGDKGLVRVREELARLYRLGCFLCDQLEELQTAYDCSRVKVRQAVITLRLSDYAEDKAALWSRLKAGELEEADYQKRILKLRERKDDFEKAYRRINDDFFTKWFPESLSSGNRGRILQILDEPNLLFIGAD